MYKSDFYSVFLVLLTFSLTFTDAIKERVKCNTYEDLPKNCTLELPILSSPEISFALTEEDLNRSCVKLRAGVECIQNFVDSCMENNQRKTFRNNYAGIVDVTNNLCTKGEYQEEYLKHASCVANVRSEYEVCSKNYEKKLAVLSNTEYDPAIREQYLKNLCCSFEEYLHCSEQTVLNVCGMDAATYVSKFLKSMASNFRTNFCHVYGKDCSLGNKAYLSTYSTFLLGVATVAHLALNAGNLVPT